MKPLIICGGCSFTHGPDTWAQVIGNFKGIWNNTAQQNHKMYASIGSTIPSISTHPSKTMDNA